MRIPELQQTDKIAYGFLIVVYAMGIYMAHTDLRLFDEVLAREDGFVEYGTAIFLLYSSLILFLRFFRRHRSTNLTWKLGMLAIAIVFLFGAGEEISWGQRLFNLESPEYFLENNAQGETNLHNMVVGGVKINKVVFSQLFTAVLAIYLLVFPIIYRKWSWLKQLTDRFAIPVVRWHHTLAFLVSSVLVLLIPAERKWEVYELAFAVIFFLVFLKPFNTWIYRSAES
jgi:hypothetical protein